MGLCFPQRGLSLPCIQGGGVGHPLGLMQGRLMQKCTCAADPGDGDGVFLIAQCVRADPRYNGVSCAITSRQRWPKAARFAELLLLGSRVPWPDVIFAQMDHCLSYARPCSESCLPNQESMTSRPVLSLNGKTRVAMLQYRLAKQLSASRLVLTTATDGLLRMLMTPYDTSNIGK